MKFQGSALLQRGIAVICVYGMLARTLPAQSANPAASITQTQSSTAVPQTAVPVRFDMPKSHNPLNAYSPDYVPEPALANSPRLDRTDAGRQALSFAERRHRPCARKQSRFGHCPLQPAHRRYRHSAHPGRRIFSRRQHRSGAGNSRRRRGRFWHGRSGRRRGRHVERRGRRGCRRLGFGAVHAREPALPVSSYDPVDHCLRRSRTSDHAAGQPGRSTACLRCN